MGRLDDALSELLDRRPLTVDLELRIERRVRLYADRLNQRLTAQNDTDLFNADNDEDLGAIIMLLCETALDADDEHATLAPPATRPPHDPSPANTPTSPRHASDLRG